ncbi:D-alanyl-D-alanine carboxypeptidase family protein [Sulfurisoma sediminicola]|uniref:serine-type D-Ala-D-Ala carboxypeptidase n=1 Tax=Sulfurisoma sediminicola TaxID=1381557 RepID=A0A497XLK9_9PROT|nr:D-alanyl-D-alanine carboxypeptidase family protein [Sulfurisoma sediminicola]RLJ68280.1 penicillin-binding protein 6 [Sulfurisoma sediminicola]
MIRQFLACALLALALPALAQSVPPPPVAARSWLLLDHASNQPLAEQAADERVEPASLTKLMTAYLSFAALRQKRIALDQVVPVSERAWKAPGSRMFIELNRPVTVKELLYGMIVQSGNDACIALAEAVAGSEESFVVAMNREAQRLGLKNTKFMNATGLPDPQHYATARDLGLLAQAIIRDFPEYYPIYATKEYSYNKITQPNRNRLLWLDPTVDGVKTGHTEAAGYCLIASSRRGPRRLISVVLGTASDSARAQESLKLLNHGFLAFDAVKLYDRNFALSQLKVFKGTQNTVKAGFAEDFVLSLPKGAAVGKDAIKVQLESRQPLLAPVQQGDRIATLKLTVNDKPWGEYPVVALEAVPIAGIFGRAWDSLKLYFQ